MKRPTIENDEISIKTTDESVDLFSLIFYKTIFLNEETRDREAIRSWLDAPDTGD